MKLYEHIQKHKIVHNFPLSVVSNGITWEQCYMHQSSSLGMKEFQAKIHVSPMSPFWDMAPLIYEAMGNFPLCWACLFLPKQFLFWLVSQPFSHLIKLEILALLNYEANYQSISSCKLTYNKNLIGTTKKFDVDAS